MPIPFRRPQPEPPMVQQCAWCWRVADAAGHFSIPAEPRLAEATHGICPACSAVAFRQLSTLRSRRAA